jgi:hypothetical protein
MRSIGFLDHDATCGCGGGREETGVMRRAAASSGQPETYQAAGDRCNDHSQHDDDHRPGTETGPPAVQGRQGLGRMSTAEAAPTVGVAGSGVAPADPVG